MVEIEKVLASTYVTKDSFKEENLRLAALESKSVSEEALRTYKRVVYGALFAAGLSIVLAVINAFARTR